MTEDIAYLRQSRDECRAILLKVCERLGPAAAMGITVDLVDLQTSAMVLYLTAKSLNIPLHEAAKLLDPDRNRNVTGIVQALKALTDQEVRRLVNSYLATRN